MSLFKHGGRLLVAVALVAAGCGGGATADSAFVEATPDFDATSMELSGDDGSADDGTAQGSLEAEGALEGEASLWPAVRQTVRGINHTVARFVRGVERMVRENPETATGSTHTWVRVEGAVEYQFTMTKIADKKFEYVLGARAAADTEATYTTILDGEIAVGDEAHRGKGHIRCDLTALNSIAGETMTALGEIKVVFKHNQGVKKLWVHLKDYQKDAASPKANAAYVYSRLGRGKAGAIKLAIHANLNDPSATDKAAPEWLLVRGRWLAGFRARFDAVAFGGDIAEGSRIRGTECLDGTGAVVYKRLVLQPLGIELIATVGTREQCAPGLHQEPTQSELPDDQEAAEAEAMSEAELEAPPE